jgi:hypothetical protein
VASPQTRRLPNNYDDDGRWGQPTLERHTGRPNYTLRGLDGIATMLTADGLLGVEELKGRRRRRLIYYELQRRLIVRLDLPLKSVAKAPARRPRPQPARAQKNKKWEARRGLCGGGGWTKAGIVGLGVGRDGFGAPTVCGTVGGVPSNRSLRLVPDSACARGGVGGGLYAQHRAVVSDLSSHHPVEGAS